MKQILLVLFLTFLTTTISAQKVGLVLSGGGAKGLYHIGMIKALEDNNIPIDYVAGASQGAIVGAMYSAGYSPDEMLAFFATDSVETWLTGKIPDKYRYYFKKFDPTPEIISLKINPDTVKFANVFRLPTNLISPYLIDLAFIKMITNASAAANNNFDSLMVPFRCVASDTYNKSLVVFKDGDLPFAVRASMTIPFAFKPLKKDSTLLYDGGMYNNFPWQTLEADFKPDIYIGGVVASNYANPSQDNIVGQISIMITKDTDYNLPDTTDILIKRKFKDVSTFDYDKAAYIMACGYEDAMRLMPEILKKIERRVTQQQIKEKRNAFKSKLKPVIYESIEVEGLTNAQRNFVYRQLDVRDENMLISAEYFEQKYLRILASDIFTGEFPRVTYNPQTGYFRLKVKMNTQPSMQLSLGGNMSSSALTQLYLGYSYRTVKNSASTYGLNLYLGTFHNAANAVIRHDRFTRFPFFFEYSIGYEQFDRNSRNSEPYYRNQSWRAIDHTDYYVNGALAVPYLNNSAFRVHMSATKAIDKYYLTYFTTQDSPSETEFLSGSITAEVQNQSFNYPIYPSKGDNQIIQFQLIGGLETFRPGSLDKIVESELLGKKNRTWLSFRAMRESYRPINKWFTLGYLVDLALSNHPDFANNIATALTLPTFAPTPLTQTIFMPQYRSKSFLGVGIMPIINFNAKQDFYLRAYAYAFIPQEFVFDDGWKTPTMKRFGTYSQYIFGGSIVYQSIIGPASFSVTKLTTGPAAWNFVFNIGYNLFTIK